MKAKFISLEGIEGAGKSTAVEAVNNILKIKNIPYINTREPGGGPNGGPIRNILLESNDNISSISELLLMFADRVDHVEKVIIPNLDKGVWVISDRYIDSSLAYQGGGRGIDVKIINALISNLNLPQPDLTLLFDLPVQMALTRAKNRGALDRFEREDFSFHERVRTSYLNLAQLSKNRIKIVDSSKEKKAVEDICVKFLLDFLAKQDA